jgi:hypothetical protein
MKILIGAILLAFSLMRTECDTRQKGKNYKEYNGYYIEWNKDFGFFGGSDYAYTSHYTENNGCITFRDTTYGRDYGIKTVCGSYSIEEYKWYKEIKK